MSSESIGPKRNFAREALKIWMAKPANASERADISKRILAATGMHPDQVVESVQGAPVAEQRRLIERYLGGIPQELAREWAAAEKFETKQNSIPKGFEVATTAQVALQEFSNKAVLGPYAVGWEDCVDKFGDRTRNVLLIAAGQNLNEIAKFISATTGFKFTDFGEDPHAKLDNDGNLRIRIPLDSGDQSLEQHITRFSHGDEQASAFEILVPCALWLKGEKTGSVDTISLCNWPVDTQRLFGWYDSHYGKDQPHAHWARCKEWTCKEYDEKTPIRAVQIHEGEALASSAVQYWRLVPAFRGNSK